MTIHGLLGALSLLADIGEMELSTRSTIPERCFHTKEYEHQDPLAVVPVSMARGGICWCRVGCLVSMTCE